MDKLDKMLDISVQIDLAERLIKKLKKKLKKIKKRINSFKKLIKSKHMKKIIVFLIVFLNVCAIKAQQQQTPRIVTGNLIYNRYDYQPDEKTVLDFNGKTLTVSIDSINDKTVKELLNKSGVPDSLILFTYGYGSSILNRIEIFFAFNGVMQARSLDLSVHNPHEKFSSQAAQDALLIPQYQNANIQKLQAIAVYIANKYPLNSFMIKPFIYPALPHLVIANGVVDGILADMRNIKCSSRLLDYFIELNYQIIWYQDCEGKVKTLNRQKGWKPTPRS